MSMDIRALAYLVAETTDVAAWKTYAEQVFKILNPEKMKFLITTYLRGLLKISFFVILNHKFFVASSIKNLKLLIIRCFMEFILSEANVFSMTLVVFLEVPLN